MVNYKIFKSFGNKRQKNFPLRNKNIYRSEYVSLELNIPLIIEGKIKYKQDHSYRKLLSPPDPRQISWVLKVWIGQPKESGEKKLQL